MKHLLIFLTLTLGLQTYAQDEKTVALVVSGQGKTQDEAKQNALRSAIEQAFGTFISSKTEILNDNLVKDEIVSVANGNIQKFEIISEAQIPNGDYATTLKAIVSIEKLTSFVESKGFEIEFKGTLFGANLKQQRINEDAELKAIINLCEVSNQILSKSIDYTIDLDEPLKANSMRSFQPQQNDYQILFAIKLSPNKNFDNFANYFYSNIKAISMPISEQENYIYLNKDIYFLTVNKNEKFFFRNSGTVIALQNLFLKSNQYLHNFKVVSNLDTIIVNTCCFDYDSELGSQNMYYTYEKPEIWHLNSGNSVYSPEGSKNSNPGYPQFKFSHHNPRNPQSVSSWRTYFEYLLWLRNNKILFVPKNYFIQNGSDYIKNGNSAHFSWPQFPFNLYPGVQSNGEINLNIGEIDLKKMDYFCKYLAIYSEEEISRITKILVEPLK